MAEVTYDIRSRLIERQKHFKLLPDALVWTTSKGEGRIAYSEVKRANLMSGMSQYGMAANCTIWPKKGKRLIFGTVHFASMSSYENRAAAYGPFVRELLRRIAEASPDAAFTRGSPFDVVLLKIGIGLLVGVGLIAILTVGGFRLAPEPAILAFFAFIVLTIPALLSLMRKYSSKPIDPHDVPDDLVGPREPLEPEPVGTN